MASKLNTVIFDMDGLLIDSEPLWELAGTEVLAQYGCRLSHQLYVTSVGLRTREWLEHWFRHFSVANVDLIEAEKRIIDKVIEKVQQGGKPMPGVRHIFEYFLQRQFTMAIATSSPMRLANIVVDILGIRPLLANITSAEALPYGKPHPQVYINCAEALGANPADCLCFEDSFNGMIAVKAAKMKCVAVPSAAEVNSARWGAADLKISSLRNFNDLLMQQL